ncbi:MAG: response regulator, partial [Saprospiraceae bacterium]|nr:response regulator [Saprospiraceae bacterium]
LSVLPVFGAHAQKKRLEPLVSPEVISKHDTRAIIEDSYGFIWHGGTGGLFKYDGFDSKAVRSGADSTTFSLGTVNAIVEDKNKDLWIGSTTGLFRYERATDSITPVSRKTIVKENGGVSTVYALHLDVAGRLWIGTEDNLYVLKNSVKPPVKLLDDHTFPPTAQMGHGVLSLSEDSQGRVYAGTSLGLWQVKTDLSIQKFAPATGAKIGTLGFRIQDMATVNGDTLWLTSPNGLWLFDTRNEQLWHVPLPNMKNKRLMTVGFSQQKRLWLAISGQIWERSTDGTMTSVSGPPASFFQSIGILETDRFGNLWAGGFNGLAKIELAANQALPFYQVAGDSPDQDNACLRLMQDPSGGFWFRMINSGLGYCAELGGAFEIVLQPPRDFTNGEIRHFCADADGNVWVLTLTNGLYRFPKGSKQGQQVLADDSMRVAVGLSILSDRKDERLLWFTSNLGLCSVDRHSLQRHWFFPKKDLPWLDKAGIGYLEQDDDGNFWCTSWANDRGIVLHFDRTSGKFSGEPDPAKRPEFRVAQHLKRISKDTIWLATTTGVLIIDTRRKTQSFWDQSNGFPTKGAGSIVPDGRGNVWFSSGGKICRWDGRKFQCFSARKESAGFFYCNATLALDGRLVFGGKSGIHVFEPEKIRKDTIRPRVYLSSFKVLNQPHRLGQALELVREIRQPFDSKVLTFEYAAVHHLHPDAVQFRHKLEGFETDWVETDSRERWATYTNLSPGSYTFRVLAANADGLWTNAAEGLAIKLVILPPWYRSWWAYLFYIVAGLALLLALRRFELRRQLAKVEARRLQELDAVKTRLYTNITHEFRTPLTVMLGEAAQLEKHAEERQKGSLDAIRRQGRHLLNLVNQMLDLAKIEAGSLGLNMEQGNVVLFLKYLLESFHSLAAGKQIELRFEADAEEFWMDYDPDKLQKIVSNLLSNAVKFTPPGGQVTLWVATDRDLHFSVLDTGPGIPPEKLPLVFDRFYQADDSPTRQAEGTGIGLTLTKELVHLLGGRISAESRPGGGALFFVTLPVARTAAKQPVQSENSETAQDPEPSAAFDARSPVSDDQQSRPRLLLIEDNADVVRYVASLLAADYEIHEAANGREGVEAAFRLVPDLVISDVMMPEMDGYQVCRILKTDELTCHIPIVLLTAKADRQSKIKGLTHGADEYLPKPFDPEELFVRLEKLLELRRRLQEKYAGPDQLSTLARSAAASLDELFLQKAISIVEVRLADEEFDMPQLCLALNMSRSNLFRKLKALTGKSATDFIRSIRLKKAKDLLETTDMNVMEVCYAVGFGSPNYFSRVFQEAFGVTPSEVRKR